MEKHYGIFEDTLRTGRFSKRTARARGNKSFYIWLLRGTEAEAILYICFYKMYGRIVPVFFVNSVIISVKV
jgi:hypothetical protein